jgi:23S rRNA (cytosine1962-C5)-methyltransferase
MFAPEVYQLSDFGNGRRLEQFGPWRLDRPCPSAERIPVADPALWELAQARFERTGENEGKWRLAAEVPKRWTIALGPLVFEIKRTPFGHLGLFPEQAANWDWLAEQVAKTTRPVKVLNLFAYTGGSTLAAAAAGAEVVHVDAAANIVAWARRNAELSGLAEAPVRWIVEDAMKFAKRELRRGAQYDAVILDPPSYGHGAHGEVWRLSQHLPHLLRMCAQLTAGRRQFALVTSHTPDFGPRRLERLLGEALGDADPGATSAGPMSVRDVSGRELLSGAVVRWVSGARHP